MGALTIAINNRGIMGDLKYAEVTATFSSSYATSGDTGLTATALGWDSMVAGIVTSHDDGFTFAYNISSGTVLVYRLGFTDQGAADANNTIMATAGVLGISGTGTAFQQALPQVINATDLSTTPGTVRLLMLGR
jgi:hypothetical protein